MDTITSADGTTLAFDRLGAGPPVVIVPGATCTRGVTAPLAQALAAGCTVINLDRRGRGDSDDRSGAPYAADRETEDLAAVLAAVGPAALYGHSSGAAVVLRATAAGLPVTRLVLHDAPYDVEPSQHSRDYHAELHRLLDAGAHGDAIELFLRGVGMPEAMIAGMRHAPHWPGMEAVAPTLAYDSAALADAEGGAVPYDLLGRVARADPGPGRRRRPRLHGRRRARAAPRHRRRAVRPPGRRRHDAGPELVAPVAARLPDRLRRVGRPRPGARPDQWPNTSESVRSASPRSSAEIADIWWAVSSKSKSVDVLGDPARVGGLGDGDQPVLQVPAQDHLGGRTCRPPRRSRLIMGSARSSAAPDAPIGLQDSITMSCCSA